MGVIKQALSAVRRLLIVGVIAIVFLFGMAATVFLSLRSPVVRVPDVVGKDRFEAERELESAGLKLRQRATRPSSQTKPDTVLFQLPRAGEEVKEGQTVAVDVSRAAKEGEASETATDDKANKNTANQNTNPSSSGNTANENKPPKRKKNTNANANGNTNGNANGNANRSNRNQNRRPPAETPTPAGADPSSTPPPGI